MSRKAGEVVDREAQLVAVGAGAAGAAVWLPAADAGVVHQDAESVQRCVNLSGHAADLVEVGEVRGHGPRSGYFAGRELVCDAVEFGLVAAVQDQVGAVGCQAFGQGQAEAVGAPVMRMVRGRVNAGLPGQSLGWSRVVQPA